MPDADPYVTVSGWALSTLLNMAESIHPLGVSQDDCNDECVNASAIRSARKALGLSGWQFQPARLPLRQMVREAEEQGLYDLPEVNALEVKRHA